MYCVGAGYFGRRYYAGDIQVTFCCRPRPDTDGLVGQSNVQAIVIRLGMNSHRFDAHLSACPNYAACNLAAISYKNFFKH